MKLKPILICTIAAILLCLVACASAPQEVSVDASYSGKEAELGVGGSLIVTLESNPASTGFQWELTENSDETVLQRVDQRYEPPEEGGMVGAPGKEIWTFKALKKGESSISLEYSQPWEGGTKAAETFELTVVVM
jgi:inhibitor of cysteine peptidase